MITPPKRIAVLGSTGSIGRSTLEVVAHWEGEARRWEGEAPAEPAALSASRLGRSLALLKMEIVALSGHSKVDQLLAQARAVRPRWVVITDEQAARQAARSDWPKGTELLVGQAGLRQVVQSPEVDIVVAAIVGSAGLASTWAAIEAGKTVALANKETLVVAGPLAMQLAARTGATILPVDSEHSAVFQALACGRKQDVKRIILTASGGPLRNHTREQLENVTVDEALAHPTWEMGPKITIDSATMMNKALELIEARWLFDLPPEQIEVVVHPQSIVHSLVEFIDGSVIAQLSPPDMKLPIQYALTYPLRCPSPADKLDWTQSHCLEFHPPDEDRFPALKLGREVATAGGTAGAVLNAANEAAVAEFLAGRISLTSIVPACRAVLQSHHFDPSPTLDALLQLDAWARSEISQWIYA